MAVDGARLYSLLTSLDHPLAASLSPEALDWVCETPECAEFLEWIVNNLSKENVVTEGDLEAFKLIPEEEVLSGQILSQALSTFGMADGQRMTEQELSREVNRLELELGLLEESRDKLQLVNERLGAEMTREQEKVSQLDHLEERAMLEERRSQEKILELNAAYNKTMKETRESVIDLTRLYEAAKEDMDSPHFLASINLSKIKEADSAVDQEVQALMTSYFSEVSNGVMEEDELSEQRRGREQDEFDKLVAEISRLRVSLVRQQLTMMKARAEEAGLMSVAKMFSDKETVSRLPAGAVKQVELEIKILEDEACQILEQSVDLQCQKIMNIEQKNKEIRNSLVIKRLENIRDVLLQQLAKKEILSVLLDSEMKNVRMVEDLLKDMTGCVQTEFTKFSQFKAAMASLGGRKSENDGKLIPAEDFVMQRVHKVLHSRKLVGHMASYEEVFTALEKLKEENESLDNKLQAKERAVSEDIASETDKMFEILSLLTVKENSKQTCLTPKDIDLGLKTVQKTMLELNESFMKVNKSWKKDVEELNIKPELAILRDVWIDFIVKPRSLIAATKNLEMKAQNCKK